MLLCLFLQEGTNWSRTSKQTTKGSMQACTEKEGLEEKDSILNLILTCQNQKKIMKSHPINETTLSKKFGKKERSFFFNIFPIFSRVW